MFYWSATFDDGSILIQSVDDVSTIDPKRSSYWDFLVKSEKIKVNTFTIHLDSDNRWTVDLKTGMFNHNGISFKCEPSMSPMNITGPFELIWYKDNTINWDPSTGENDIEVKYRIGWKSPKFTQSIVVG